MVTRSRVESEYKSLISASAKLAWLQSLFSKIGGCCMEKPIVCYDNISATKLARNPIYHSKTKHIEIDTHFIENKVLVGELNIQYIPSEERVIDVMTKLLSCTYFNYLRAKLNVHCCPLSFKRAGKATHHTEHKKAQPKSSQVKNTISSRVAKQCNNLVDSSP